MANTKIGRNQSCPCGSGYKYKKCCGSESKSYLPFGRHMLIFAIVIFCFIASFAAYASFNSSSSGFNSSSSGADNTLQHKSIDNEEITPETWRNIDFEMRKPDGSKISFWLLRPLWWIERSGVEEGGYVDLSIPEMGVEGKAKVLSVKPCTADSRKAPPGYRNVTGKFCHENAVVFDLYFNNDTRDPLGVTPNHPLWSTDRNGWVRAGNLRIGEHVETKDNGVAKLTSRKRRPGRHKVYNLEVHKDHTYYVSNLGILAHNACSEDNIWKVVAKRLGHWGINPTQSKKKFNFEYINDLSKKMSKSDFDWGNKKIIVSPDGYILDGHHHAVAAAAAGIDIPKGVMYRTKTPNMRPPYDWNDILPID